VAEVRAEHVDGIAVVTLNAPERRNALTAAMARELSAALSAAEADPGVRALVVHGAGRSFCAGAVLSLLEGAGADPLSDESRVEINDVYEAFTHLGRLTVPSIAAVHGHAIGAGLNLALAADLRVVGESAHLMSGFHRIGLHPGGGHLSLLAQAAGPQTAAAMALFDLEVRGAEAVARGLAWEVVPDVELLDRAIAIASAATADVQLSRHTVRNLRLTSGPPMIPMAAAVEIERGSQQWSLRRRMQPGAATSRESET
jgi:enoyl-CoA hydratase